MYLYNWCHQTVDIDHYLCNCSGSTGKPKGVLHTVGGYMLYAVATCKYVFDLQPDDIYWCTADVGWITGHTYVCYGPLGNAVTGIIVRFFHFLCYMLFHVPIRVGLFALKGLPYIGHQTC